MFSSVEPDRVRESEREREIKISGHFMFAK